MSVGVPPIEFNAGSEYSNTSSVVFELEASARGGNTNFVVVVKASLHSLTLANSQSKTNLTFSLLTLLASCSF